VPVVRDCRSPLLWVPEAGEHLPTQRGGLGPGCHASAAAAPALAHTVLASRALTIAANEECFQTGSLTRMTFYESPRCLCLYHCAVFSTVRKRKQSIFWSFSGWVFAAAQGAQSPGSVIRPGVWGTASSLPGLLSAVVVLGSPSHLALYIFIPSGMTLFSHIFKAPNERGRRQELSELLTVGLLWIALFAWASGPARLKESVGGLGAWLRAMCVYWSSW